MSLIATSGSMRLNSTVVVPLEVAGIPRAFRDLIAPLAAAAVSRKVNGPTVRDGSPYEKLAREACPKSRR